MSDEVLKTLNPPVDLYMILHNGGSLSVGQSEGDDEVNEEKPWYVSVLNLGLTTQVLDRNNNPVKGYTDKRDLGNMVIEMLYRLLAEPEKLRYINQRPQFTIGFSRENRGKPMTHIQGIPADFFEDCRAVLKSE